MTEAEYLASITGVMEKEVSAEVVQVVLDAIAAAGQEVAAHGSSEIVEELTRQCPDCEGSLGGGGGNTDEPAWTCETCVWGRTGLLTAKQRELLVMVLDNGPGWVAPRWIFDAEQVEELVKAREALAADLTTYESGPDQPPAEPQEEKCMSGKEMLGDAIPNCSSNEAQGDRFIEISRARLIKEFNWPVEGKKGWEKVRFAPVAEPQGDVVEGLAREIAACLPDGPHGFLNWDCITDETRDELREDARRILAAITPLLPGPSYALEVRERLEDTAGHFDRQGWFAAAEHVRNVIAALDKEDTND